MAQAMELPEPRQTICNLGESLLHRFEMAYAQTDMQKTVDGQLVRRGCCPFRQYVSSQGRKFDIDLWLAADVGIMMFYEYNKHVASRLV
jgi:hypothetical protein